MVGNESVFEGLSVGGSLADTDSGPRDEVLRLAASGLSRAYGLAGLILGDDAEAQDATQDALLRAWRSADSLRKASDFQAWFDRILVNACVDRLRRRAKVRYVRLLEVESTQEAPDSFRQLLNSEDILRTMATLSPPERAVVVLRYWADLTVPMIAERLGWPTGTVKSRLNRSLEKMRVELRGSQGEER